VDPLPEKGTALLRKKSDLMASAVEESKYALAPPTYIHPGKNNLQRESREMKRPT